jgi:hypothetical protein
MSGRRGRGVKIGSTFEHALRVLQINIELPKAEFDGTVATLYGSRKIGLEAVAEMRKIGAVETVVRLTPSGRRMLGGG